MSEDRRKTRYYGPPDNTETGIEKVLYGCLLVIVAGLFGVMVFEAFLRQLGI